MKKKILAFTILSLVLTMLLSCSLAVFAEESGSSSSSSSSSSGSSSSGGGGTSVSDTAEKIYKETEKEIKSISDKVIFPAVRIVLAVVFIVVAMTAIFSYNKSKEINWTLIAVSAICLILAIVGPKFIWNVLT